MAAGNYKAIDDLQFPFGEYVLALPGWYPTWLDPLPGDFNQRHIKAACAYKPQVVLYIGKDPSGTLQKTTIRANQLSDRVLEIIVLYPKSKLHWWDSIQSNGYFLLLLFKFSNIIKQKWGKPALLHSYIVMRGGLAGLILSKKWKKPFLLTENWTIYYPADPGYLPTRNFIFRWMVQQVFKNLSMFLPVTNNLKNQAAKLLGEVNAMVVPNVVETERFHLKDPGTERFRFIHISTMIYQKNPEGLLRGFKAFNAKNPGTHLQMVGPYPPEVAEYAKKLRLEKQVEFTGPVSYLQVAELLKQSNALVLFSRYENLPCVILEAFCSGLPVISTKVGGITEVINPENGILIDSENEQQLIDALTSLYKNYDLKYKGTNISKAAKETYSYNAVGRKINDAYEALLKI